MGITVAANLYILAAITMVVMTFIVWFFYSRKKSGVIYILVVHYEGEATGDAVMKALSGIRYQMKSRTVRKDRTEMTVEIMAKHNNTAFMNTITALEGVSDASLIQYNGEYNG